MAGMGVVPVPDAGADFVRFIFHHKEHESVVGPSPTTNVGPTQSTRCFVESFVIFVLFVFQTHP